MPRSSLWPPAPGASRKTWSVPDLVAGVAGGPWEGNGVAHVGEAGDVGDGALEAQAEAGVRHGAVATEVAIPGHVLAVDADGGHALIEQVQALFALAAADDLADAGREHVHRGDGAPVLVQAHVERLDVLRIVHD